jgi:hypothetical protein
MTKSKETTAPTPVPEAPLVPPAPPSPEQEMFEKVALMANLTSAVQNASLKTHIMELPGGEKIYQLLVKAVHQEIESIMGKSNKDAKELSTNMQQMAVAMSKFVSIVNTFNDMKLVGVLNAIAQKLKPLGDLGQPQQFIDNQQQNSVDQSRGEEVSSDQQVYAGPGMRAPRNPGLGSF